MSEKTKKEPATAKVSRRDILKGAMGIGVAAAAGSALSAFPGVSEAAILKPPQKWNMEADVVVVGAGLAGLAAATEALERGAGVILLEKRPTHGGSSAVSTGSILCTGSKLQMQAGIKDSPAELVKHLLNVNENLSDVALVKVLADRIGADIDWLSAHDVQFIPGVYTVMGSPVARALLAKGAGSGLTNPLFATAKAKGAKIFPETKGESLYKDDKGRIVGLSAVGKTGKPIAIRAKKGVILTSGGFCASKEHMMRFATTFYNYVVASAPGSTGDGITMAWSAGSDFIHMDAVLPTPTVEVSSGMLITSYVLDTGAGILVSEEGKRFCNETGGYFKTALDVGEQVQRQKNKYVFELFGKNAREKVPRVNDYLKAGFVTEADTVEELAGKLGCKPAVLAETVRKYNEAVEKKSDPEFGRQSLKAKLEPKFGALRIAPGSLASTGGLRVNTDSKVLDTAGKPIPGLYAAGEVTGGISVRGTVGGDYLGAAVVFGRIAGRNAAGEKPGK